MDAVPSTSRRGERARRYAPPTDIRRVAVGDLVLGARTIPTLQQERFGFAESSPKGFLVWCAGEPALVKLPCVSVVGTRKVSAAGTARARRLGRELSAAGVVVVSGLAAGVDSVAMNSAITHGGKVIGVIGTGLGRAYPAANASLQELIYREHLLVSQFDMEAQVYRSNFPKRNQLMAALSDATAIVEASDTSGTLHQAAECRRLGRPLFIAKSIVEDSSVTWPARFVGQPGVHVLENTSQILSAIHRS